MKLCWVLGVLIAALILFSGSAFADPGWGFGTGIDGLHIEVNMGDGWQVYDGNPYKYRYNDWYYFDHPYRYLNGGSYYNFNSGWYYYEPSWYSQPYGHGAYDYYSPNYYPCCGGMWYYDPSWDYGMYPQTYGYGAPYGGYGFVQESDCARIDMYVGTLQIDAGYNTLVNVQIFNRTNSRFDVSDMEVYVDSFGMDVREIRTPEYVPAHGTRNATFRLYVDDDARGERVGANIKLAGQFTGGNYCNYGAVGPEYFDVYVRPHPVYDHPEEPEEPGPGHSTSRIVYEPSMWVEIGPGEGKRVVECAPGYVVPSCAGLDIVSHSITVQAGGRQNEEFWLKNYSTEDFYIDSVDVYETSNNFVLGTGLSDSVVFKDSDFGKIALVVNAFEVERDYFSKATVEVAGHFESGVHCTIPAEEVYVYVNTEQNRCGGLAVEVPNEVEFAAGAQAGVVRIALDNPLAEHATVTVSAENADVYPSTITVQGEMYAERVLYVTLASQGDARLDYRVSAGNCALAEKFTNVRYAPAEGTAEVEIGVEGFPQEIEVVGPKKAGVVVRNNSEEYTTVRADVGGLPGEFYVRGAQAELAPGEAGVLVLELFQNGAEAGSYEALLKVSAGETEITRAITIVVRNGEGAGAAVVTEGEGAETGEDGEGAVPATAGGIAETLGGAAGTAMVVLGDNAVNFGIVILILILIYILYRAVRGSASVGNRHWAGA